LAEDFSLAKISVSSTGILKLRKSTMQFAIIEITDAAY